MSDHQHFPPYDAVGPHGEPVIGHKPGIPIPDNSRKMAKQVIKMAKVKMPKMHKPKFKSDIKWW
jgi:hypothetical protein